MDSIFHETQEGALCAQHCLNALLQGSFFTAVDLANLATELDEEERQRMAEGDVNSDEYQRFLKQPSHNVDDTGFFSVQVLSKALSVWSLQMIPFNSQQAKNARENPLGEHAFICNLQQHWLAIRKLGKQWFNLNSLLTGPELLSDTHLGLFLAQLQNEGYSIFVVQGAFPPSTADEILSHQPAVQTIAPHLVRDDRENPQGAADGHFDSDLAAAIAASSRQTQDDLWAVGDSNRPKVARLETHHRRWSGDGSIGKQQEDLGFVSNVEMGVTEGLRQETTDMGVLGVGDVSFGAAQQETKNEASGLVAAGTTASVSSQTSELTVDAMERAIAFSLSRVLGHTGQTISAGHGGGGFLAAAVLPARQTVGQWNLPIQPVVPHSSSSQYPREHSFVPSLPPLELPLSSISMPTVRHSPEERIESEEDVEDELTRALALTIEAPCPTVKRVIEDDSFMVEPEDLEEESDDESLSQSPTSSGPLKRQVSEMTEEEMMMMAMQLSERQSQQEGKNQGSEASD